MTAGGAPDRPGGGSAESSPYFTRRHHSHNKPLERYQSCMTLPSEGLVDPLDRVRDRARAEGEDRGMGTGSSGPASPRSVNSAPCGLEDHHTGASRLGLALPLGLTHSSPTASPQRMEWKVNNKKSSQVFPLSEARVIVLLSVISTIMLKEICKNQIHK